MHQSSVTNNNIYNITETNKYTLSKDKANYTSSGEECLGRTRNVERAINRLKVNGYAEYTENFNDIISYFFSKYANALGVEHKQVSNMSWDNIIENYLAEPATLHGAQFEEEDYLGMIDMYFEQKWKDNIQMSISHFFSSGIKDLLYERYVVGL